MSNISTTKMSSRGQVVIPEEIRNQLNLKSGAQFIVLGEKDVIIFKTITPPSIEEFENLISKTREKGKEAGIKKSDISEAISKARQKSK